MSDMQFLSFKNFFNVLILMYVIVDPPRVISRGKRGRIHQRDNSMRDKESIEVSDIHQFPSNSLEADEYGDLEADEYRDLHADELNNYSTNDKEVEKSRHKRIDPKGSWLTFVNRLGDSKPDRRKRKKKRKRKSNNILLGPPGPAGPPGPPGPAGRSVSKEDIIAGLEHLIKEEATRRAQQMFADMMSENLTPFNGSSTIVKQPGLTPPILVIPRIYAGFSLRLGSKTKVDRKSFREIKSFQQPFGGGGFQRGEAFNAKEGRFFPPMDGIYQFTVNLQLRIRTKRKLTDRLKTDENIRIIICIDSLCQTNTSIETITGVNIDNKMLTSSVTGLLLLKEKQYVSLYVDNSCSYTVLALAGSEFSGILLGT